MICNISVWALLISTVVSLGVAAAWYSDYILGKQWKAYVGNLFNQSPSPKTLAKLYAIQFVLTLVTNFALARALLYTGTTTWPKAVAVALAVWIGFVAVIEGSGILWEKKPWKLVAINAGSYLVTFIISAIILVAWI